MMKLNIAICDDNKLVLENEKTLIEETLKEMGMPYKMDKYQNPENLIKNAWQYDLVFLDVEMDEVNGIVAAESIHNVNKECLLFFVTNHEVYMDYAMNEYAFRFWIKPIIEGHKAQDSPGQSHTAGQQSHDHHGDDGRGPGIGGNAPEHRADQASGQGQGHYLQYRQDHPLVLYLTQGQVAVLVGKRTHEPQIRHRDPGQPGAVEPPALGDGVKAQGRKDIDGQAHQGHYPAANNIGDEVQDPAGIVIV